MPRPKRNLHATVEETLNPPSALTSNQAIARIIKVAGNNLYNAELLSGERVLVELEARFRSTIWIKRGSYVLVDLESLADRENKLDGEIVNVVRDEKAWRKMGYWYVIKSVDTGYMYFAVARLIHRHRPQKFAKKSAYDDSDAEESTVGKMPPADSEDEE